MDPAHHHEQAELLLGEISHVEETGAIESILNLTLRALTHATLALAPQRPAKPVMEPAPDTSWVTDGKRAFADRRRPLGTA